MKSCKGRLTFTFENKQKPMQEFLEFFMHSEEYLLKFSHQNVWWLYSLLFLMVYCETGLVIMPFLPGDGLLFSAGVIAASGALQIEWLVVVLLTAAVLGNLTNYFIGRSFGQRLLSSRWKLLRSEHVERTHLFYEKHGGKALVLGRFLPIVRTFVPFVAGIGRMEFRVFQYYNMLGALAWVPPLTLAGFFFGELPWVQQNFGLIYLGLVIATGLPLLWGVMKLVLEKMWVRVKKDTPVE